ncbi:crotonase/enoyl-CoA hydratase family protein [Desulfococcaceae bacterium OttesenSCG-928-F15]|nr:crotonase/enoyl-CoA hydratase family protein [Desulfococcaceae bacterium OttesenSCG-928-F15]
MAEESYYLVEKKGHVAWVYLNRPHKKNAMNLPAWTDAPAVYEELDADPDVRVIVVSGKGECFTAGIDLISMAGAMPELLEEQKGGAKWRLLPKIKMMQDTMSCIDRCRKPVIAAVHGYCIGAGLDMISACDIRLCSADAVFSLKETAVGFVADVGSLQRVPRIVGEGVARELAYTAKNIDAKRAKEVSLVNEIYPDYESLMAAAQAMAEEIAAQSPLAVQASKVVLNYGRGRTVDACLDYVATISANIIPSDDLMEAFTAFAEKRKPVFTGK